MPEADETLLYLVRHGATPANEQRPYVLQGHGIDTSCLLYTSDAADE